MTRNQIKKRQAVITKRLYEIFRYSGVMLHRDEPQRSATDPPESQERVEREKVEAETLRKELKDLDTKWNQSSDAGEPSQESYIPPSVTERIPLLVLLHGAGWTGGSQVELWECIAERETIALLAPTSLNREWTHHNDYLTVASKLDHAVSTMPIDSSRIYLVGHSRGGAQALRMGLMKSGQVAALALHSPSMDHGVCNATFAHSGRRLPVRVWAGSDHERDCNRAWAEVLEIHFREHPELGVNLDLKLLDGHSHSDYNIREGLLDEMWSFLKNKSSTL